LGGSLISELVGWSTAFNGICQCKLNRCLNYQTCKRDKRSSKRHSTADILTILFFPYVQILSNVYIMPTVVCSRSIDHDPNQASGFQFFKFSIYPVREFQLRDLEPGTFLIQDCRTAVLV
jgi:hypothetical protein